MSFGRMMGWLMFVGLLSITWAGMQWGDPSKRDEAFIVFGLGQLLFAHALLTRKEAA